MVFYYCVIFTLSLLRYFIGQDLVRFGHIYKRISTWLLFELVIVGFSQGFLLVFSHYVVIIELLSNSLRMPQLFLRVFGSVTVYAVAGSDTLIGQWLQVNRSLCLFEFFLGQILEKIFLVLLWGLLIIGKLTLLALIFLDPHFYQLLLLFVLELHHVFEEFLRRSNRFAILLELHTLGPFCVSLIVVE